MDFPDIPILYHWFDETVQLLQRLSIVVMAALIAIRMEWLRQALRGVQLKWRYRIISMLVFGLLAIIGTHSSIVIDLGQSIWPLDLSAPLPAKLTETQAVLGFRDTMTLAAGLIGGPWVGFGTGLIAGAERYYLGGLAGFASGLATWFLGIYAGGLRYFRPHWLLDVKGVFWVALVGTLLHRLFLLILVRPYADALELAWEVVVPVGIVNTLGCVLFFWLLRDLDRDRLESEAREARLLAVQAELRALRAQIDPHFLNNTLNDLNALILFNPDKARKYVSLLARFFKYTRRFADQNTVNLAQEVMQVHRFLVLQRLELDEKLQYSFSIPKELGRLQVLPGCLLTLVENAFKHGFTGQPAPYQLDISAGLEGANLILRVSDNGRGMPAERMQALGHCQLKSDGHGSGVALCQLRQSLQLLFGDTVRLSFASQVGKGTVVTLQQPIQEGVGHGQKNARHYC